MFNIYIYIFSNNYVKWPNKQTVSDMSIAWHRSYITSTLNLCSIDKNWRYLYVVFIHVNTHQVYIYNIKGEFCEKTNVISANTLICSVLTLKSVPTTYMRNLSAVKFLSDQSLLGATFCRFDYLWRTFESYLNWGSSCSCGSSQCVRCDRLVCS